MRSRFKSLAAAVAALTITGGALAAQTSVDYVTSGTFSGTSCAAGSSLSGGPSVWCILQSGANAIKLEYFGETNSVVPTGNAPENASFGYFKTSVFAGTPSTNITATDVKFQMTVVQSAPWAGSQNAPVSPSTITGTIKSNGSTLVWYLDNANASWTFVSPTPTQGYTSYVIDRDITNGMRIFAPNYGGGTGISTISGSVAIVPEPSTYALMATGLVAMAMVRRRRQA